MPRGDGTGPMGKAPMTGKGVEICAGYSYPGCVNYGHGWFGAGRGGRPWGGGRGRAWGDGRGRGQRWESPDWEKRPYPAYNSPTVEDEKKYVNEEINVLQAKLDDLKKYLGELEKEKK